MKLLFIILEILKIFDLRWIENHLLYFSGIVTFVIFYFLYKIIKKINKDIKRIEKNSRTRLINILRNTSKYKNEQ